MRSSTGPIRRCARLATGRYIYSIHNTSPCVSLSKVLLAGGSSLSGQVYRICRDRDTTVCPRSNSCLPVCSCYPMLFSSAWSSDSAMLQGLPQAPAAVRHEALKFARSALFHAIRRPPLLLLAFHCVIAVLETFRWACVCLYCSGERSFLVTSDQATHRSMCSELPYCRSPDSTLQPTL